MTIKQYIAKFGWQMEGVTCSLYRSMDVDVGFENNGVPDETQFQINAYDVDELTELFSEFCRENLIAKNTVTNISIVRLYVEKA